MSELAGGIPLENHAPGVEHFVCIFNEVLDAAFTADERKTILENLRFVQWTSADDGELKANAFCARAMDKGPASYIVFFAQHFEGLSDRWLKWIIAHELEHVLQFALGFTDSEDFVVLCKEIAREGQANRRAERHYGPRPYVEQLAAKGLPSDDDFDRLADDWRYLTEEQRLDVRTLASALKHENKEAQRAAG